jgi:flagellar hook-length control protein FliK
MDASGRASGPVSGSAGADGVGAIGGSNAHAEGVGDASGVAGSAAGAASGSAASGSAAPAGVQSLQAQSGDTSLINLALTEGSDATGASASALQAADAGAGAAAAVASPISVALGSLIQGMPNTTGPASPVAASALLAPAALAASSASLSANSGDAHTRDGAGEAGSGANGNGAAALQQLTSTTAPASSEAAPTPTVRVHADLDSADFPQSLADRVSFAVDNGWSSARLQVNPPQLGPIELQIAIQGEHAQVSMSTHSAVTREALESSLPKLRDMLSTQGFTQVSVDISQRSFQERSAASQPYVWSPPAQAKAPTVAAVSGAAPRVSQGVLDAYA